MQETFFILIKNIYAKTVHKNSHELHPITSAIVCWGERWKLPQRGRGSTKTLALTAFSSTKIRIL